jgi:hypothetical protein
MKAAKEAGRFEISLCRAGLDGKKSLNILKTEFGYQMKVPEPITFLNSKGMTVNFLTKDHVAAFKKTTHSIYDKWVKIIGEDLYKKAKADMAK